MIYASSATRAINCPASVVLSESVPRTPSSPEAKEGTAAHAICEQALKLGLEAEFFAGHRLEVEGSEFEVDQEMVRSVQLYLDYVRGVRDEIAGTMTIERKIAAGSVLPYLGGAMVDAAVSDGGGFHVIDFKYGEGITVDPVGNHQLLTYLLAFGSAVFKGEPTWIKVSIVQPRARSGEPIKSTDVHLDEVRGYVSELDRTAKKIQTAREELAAGRLSDDLIADGDHCRWCPALPTCPLVQGQKIEKVRSLADLPVGDLLEEQLTWVLENEAIISKWIKAVREKAITQLEQGEPLPGFKLVERKGNRTWRHSQDETLKRLRALKVFKADAIEERLRSPAQLEKLIDGKGQLDELTIRRVTGYTLATEDDPRPAANFTSKVQEMLK